MAMGSKALDPTTPYVVYEFSVSGRIYYVGIGQKDAMRDTDRWNYISKQLDRLKREGTLQPAKRRGITNPSGAAIRAMIERGMAPHDIHHFWEGLGRKEALRQEKQRIRQLLSEGCVLANVDGNTRRPTTEEVLRYLRVE